MSDHRSPDEIEREIEAERGALAQSINELQSHFSPEAMVETATGLVREHGGAFADGAARQIKQNPLALVVTGVGLAWLIAGPVRKPVRSYDRWKSTHDLEGFRDTFGRPDDRPDHREPRLAYDDRSYPTAPGLRQDPYPMEGFDERVAVASGGSAQYDDDDGRSLRDRAGDMAHSARDRAGDMAHSARDRVAAARDRVGAAAASLTPDRNSDRSAMEPSLMDRLKKGTENMSDAARDRVTAAREAAYHAQRQFDEHARQYASQGRDAYRSQPLVGGLIAFGLGAIIGASLPRTRKEDEYLGAYRDRAMSEAERIYHEESSKLQAVARAAADEAKAVASEALDQAKSGAPSGQEAVDKTENAVKSAATRVKDAAEDEADKRNLGSSVS